VAARIDAGWEAARTPVLGDLAPPTSRVVAGIVGLTLLVQVGTVLTSLSAGLDHRHAIELSLAAALMLYGALAAWLGQRALLLGVVCAWGRGDPRRAVLHGALFGGSAAVAATLLARLMIGRLVVDPVLSALVDHGHPALLFSLLVVVVLAPLVEEIVFRGFITEAFLTNGCLWASAVSGGAFALAHLHIVELPWYGLLGVGLGVLYWRHGLLGSISAHASFNLVLLGIAVIAP
jgi:membrane protease YdiL (CAAX protease family)